MAQEQFTGGRFITEADAYTPIRFQVLSDLLGGDINTRGQMLEGPPVYVQRLDASIDLVEFGQVTITDWMRLITVEELEHAPDRHKP